MPTAQEPKLQPPMEAANPAHNAQAVISKQPTAEPVPAMQQDSEMNLRGGRIVCGCSERCCGINCSWFPC